MADKKFLTLIKYLIISDYEFEFQIVKYEHVTLTLFFSLLPVSTEIQSSEKF